MQKETAIVELDAVLKTKELLEEQRQTLQQESEDLEKLEAEFDLVEQRGFAAKSDLEATQIKIEELKRRQAENQEKIAELTCHSDSSLCPLCSAPIVDRAAVIDKYKQSNLAMDNEISMLRHELANLENERQQLRKEYVSLKQKLEARKRLDTQIGQFNERLNADKAKQAANLSNMRSEIQFLSRRIEQQDFAQIERESLIAIKAEILKLDFDPAQFSAIQSQVRIDRYIEVRYQQLQKMSLSCTRFPTRCRN